MRPTAIRALALGAGLLAGCGTPPADPAGISVDATAAGRALVERALTAHGGLEPLRAAGGVTLELTGTFDLTTRLQGRSDLRPEPMPIRQTIAVDLIGRRVSHELDWHNYFASRQHLREVYQAEGPALFLDLRNRTGGWMARRPVPDPVERFSRYLPQLLLAEALDRRGTVAALGRSEFQGRPAEAVRHTTGAGDTLDILLDPDTALVVGAAAAMPMPILGDTTIEWRWTDYTDDIGPGGLHAPGRLITRLGGQVLADVRMIVRPGAEASAFDPPAGLDVGPRPEEPPRDFVPYGERPPQVETLAPGVHLLRSLRPGFHVLFVEFEDHVVAVDAPTGWHEMLQLPPMAWSTGDAISALGEKYLRAIRATAPGKPVRHVVLTHHHSDHIGGLRPFLAEGASVIAGPAAARVARHAARAPFTLSPDALSGRDTAPSIQVVRGRHALADETMEMELIELPDGNPKADGYLMVYLPRQKLLYTAAFIYPLPAGAFPPAESVDLSIFFVDWLDRSGLDVDRVVAVHGSGMVEPWHLDRLRALHR